MRLYLVQHGEAKSEAEDPERSLTIREKRRQRRSRAPRKGSRSWTAVGLINNLHLPQTTHSLAVALFSL